MKIFPLGISLLSSTLPRVAGYTMPGGGGAPTPPPRPTSTLLFRVFNPELYVGYNKYIAGIGSLICGIAIMNVGMMKYEADAELKRELEGTDERDD
tara:strand:- start:106 stop:393 length:288 start_codon:yes stop_codon:yes gene_type:complete